MKVGVIGLGHRLAHLVPLLQKAMPEAEIAAVADPDEVRVAALPKAKGTPRRFDEAEVMLAEGPFDLLMIGSPNAMHLDHLRLALETETPHIFIEKPIVVSVAETLELARLAARHDGRKRLMVGLVLRYSPLYRALRQAQADGQIGEVMSIEACEHIGPYHGSFFMRDWRRESRLSGGFMLEKCCHDLDLYQGVVGARPVRLASFGGRKKFLPERRPSANLEYLDAMAPRWGGVTDAFSGEGDIIDFQTALIEYETGASMAFHTNLNVPDEYRRFAVIGTDGMAEGDFIRNTFRVTLSDSGKRVVDTASIGTGTQDGHYGADEAMIADLVDYMLGRLETLPLDVGDALEAGITALALDEARKDRKMVDLSDTWKALDAAWDGRMAGAA